MSVANGINLEAAILILTVDQPNYIFIRSTGSSTETA